MKTELLSLLKTCKLFSSLKEDECVKLLKKFKTVYLKKNKILFHQSSLSTNLYLVVSGKLVVFLKQDNGEKKILNTIGSGETVGEMGALSNEPRSATVKALEDSVLLKLSSDEFNHLIKMYPFVMEKTFTNLMQRSRTLIQMVLNHEAVRKHIVIVPANNDISLIHFSEKLCSMTHKQQSIISLSDFSKSASGDAEQLTQFIDDNKEKNLTFIYILESSQSVLSQIAFQNADVVYVVTNGDSKPYIDPSVLKKINKNKSIKVELILLYENEKLRPHRTAAWLNMTKFDLHHHLRINQEKDWERILRFMRGQAFGLVLGGGGLRCWAQLGAIKALEKAGIPIDIVGGTSAGAIVAGHYGLHETNKDSIKGLQELSEATRKAIALTNLTWPAVSLFNSKDFTHKLYELFAGEHIEDLWINCFCVTTNLSNFSQMIYRRGRLWKTIRSSASVPGIFPPVVIKGRLQTDGGILNNLPVDVMRKFIGPQGTIIAVELTHLNEDNTDYHFPPILTFWQVVLTKLRIIHRNYTFPHFVDTFLKSLLAGASAKQYENSLAADLLISPDLSKFGLLHVKKNQEAELVKIGYVSASKSIKKWRKKAPKK
jgi:predicted acylesterase/phospholipase RssA/CRP-like cAMP-binding protein